MTAYKSWLTQSTMENLFDLHPPGLFQIDGKFRRYRRYCRNVAQIAQNGVIELLPALPSSWKQGEVSGLRARGGLTIDLAWKNGRLHTATLHASRSDDFLVSYVTRSR